jgi:hypothetical protein
MEFEEVLLSLDPTEQKSFLSLGVDFIIVNDKTIHLEGNILFNRYNYHFHLKDKMFSNIILSKFTVPPIWNFTTVQPITENIQSETRRIHQI